MSEPITAILELVVDRPLDEKPSDKPTCPYCKGKDLVSRGRMTTLIGGGDGTVDGDPNHVHNDYTCLGCTKDFCRETSDGKVWYTAQGKLLRGVPHCFESYEYTCGHCGGAVRRHYTKLDGSPTGNWLTVNRGVKMYRTFFRCEGCQREIETTEEYF